MSQQIREQIQHVSASPTPRGFVSGWPMVAIFVLFYFLSMVDRAIISLMVEPIQHDLKLTDIEMGLLLGPAFGLLYAGAGIPMGWLLDRYSRRWIATSMVALWGIATAMSGFAHNFTALFASRLGIGAGEAALSPSAYAMIAEQIPKRKLSMAYSVYTSGAFIGGGLAVVGGGWIVHLLEGAQTIAIPVLGQFYSWQIAFLLVGGLTIVCAPLALILKEDRSKHAIAGNADAVPAHQKGFIAFIRTDPIFFIGYPFAFGAVNVMVAAFIAWTPAFMSRSYGWSTGDISLAYGLTQGCAGLIDLLGIGSLVQWLHNRGVADAHVRVPAAALCVAIPTMAGGILSGRPDAFLAASALFWGLIGTFPGYAPAALQLATPPAFRARMGALYMTFIAVMGTFIGPTTVSWITERVLQDSSRIGLSLVILMAIWTPISLLVLAVAGRRLKRRDAVSVTNAEGRL